MAGVAREWLLDLSKSDLRDEDCESACREKVALHRSRHPQNGELMQYQEIDASQNQLQWQGCRTILEISLRCQDLRVVKLFRNRLTDEAAPPLVRLVEECSHLEQLHLSYNRLTDRGASEIIVAASRGRSKREAHRSRGHTLWLRLEHNYIRRAAEMFEDLRQRKVQVCEARDVQRCGPRICQTGAHVHLPYFSKQEALALDEEPPADEKASPAAEEVVALATPQSVEDSPAAAEGEPPAAMEEEAPAATEEEAPAATEEEAPADLEEEAPAAMEEEPPAAMDDAPAASQSPAAVQPPAGDASPAECQDPDEVPTSLADSESAGEEDGAAPAAIAEPETPSAPALSAATGGSGAMSSSAGAGQRRAKGCIAAEPLAEEDADEDGATKGDALAGTAGSASAGGAAPPATLPSQEAAAAATAAATSADGAPSREDRRQKKDKGKKEKKAKKERDKADGKRQNSADRSRSAGHRKRAKLDKDAEAAKEAAKETTKHGSKVTASEKKVPAEDSKPEERASVAAPKAGVAMAFFKPVKVMVKQQVTQERGAKRGIEALGNLAEMQKRLEDERNKLRLWVIKAKQEWEERQERTSRGQAPGATNEEEYYMAAVGEVIGPEQDYRAEGSIGRGVFSSVFRCKASADGKEFAVKFVRSNTMMRKAAEKEVETYRKLAKQAPKQDADGMPYLMFLSGRETFVHMGHLCMVFDLQRCDLRSALQKYGQGRGLPLQTVAQYSKQIFLALRVLRKLKIIHGDLKPDNLLMSMAKTEVKLCDFGSAMDVGETLATPYLQPRYYRAPEVMLGNPYDTQIDLWSAGVTLFELGSGKILLTGKSNNAMLHQMLELCGAVSKKFATMGAFANKHFDCDGNFLLRDPESITGLPELMPMRKFSKPAKPVESLFRRVLKEPPPNADTKTQERLLPRLSDLVAKCLRMDPSERFTPELALAHQFHKKDR